MLSIPLQTNRCIFKRRLFDKNSCMMNSIESALLPHSLIKLPKREQQAQMSPQHCYGSENSQSNSICDMDPVRPVHDLDAKFSINTLVDERTSSELARSNSVASYRGGGGDNNNKDDDDEDVYMNYCSDDSELSVGKEVADLAVDLGGSGGNSSNNNDKKSSFQLHADSLFVQRNTDTLKLPSIIRPNPTRQEEVLYKTHMYAEEIMKHQLNFMTVTKGLNISPTTLNQNNAFCPYLRTNDANNHINNATVNNSLKIGFSYLQAYASDSDLGKKWSVIEDRGNRGSAETTHFRQIHSHLNAISKMSSALGRTNHNASGGAKSQQTMLLPSNTSSRESSQSPPSSNASSSVHHHILHNDFNESSLKFSIDNILKPSFGRRITDPLWKRNKPARKSSTTQLRITSHTNIDGIDSTPLSNESIAIEKKIASLDDRTGTATSKESSNLSASNAAAAAAEHIDKTNSTTTTTSASTSDANNKGPISWPAWVYCTRYR